MKTLRLRIPQWLKIPTRAKYFTCSNLYICHLYSCVEFCQTLCPYGKVTFQYRSFLPCVYPLVLAFPCLEMLIPKWILASTFNRHSSVKPNQNHFIHIPLTKSYPQIWPFKINTLVIPPPI